MFSVRCSVRRSEDQLRFGPFVPDKAPARVDILNTVQDD